MSYTRTWSREEKIKLVKQIIRFLFEVGLSIYPKEVMQVLLMQLGDTFIELIDEWNKERESKKGG